ncbi:hypothetical protein [Thiorhodococcus minor]|uniref:BON domain-containing protein n=1 Tax=Thiorhodococcus minor TaxID=57489 RepID=A0A6M0K5R7_9GAMM|nr:hypothetical protein [Thiorhodococcus minor]NEV63685.1 hypothetical protein [Thiorhodococcus minor]
MANELLDTMLGQFQERLSLRALTAEARFLGGEAFVTIRGVEPSSAMNELARAIEQEFDELDLSLRITLRLS